MYQGRLSWSRLKGNPKKLAESRVVRCREVGTAEGAEVLRKEEHSLEN